LLDFWFYILKKTNKSLACVMNLTKSNSNLELQKKLKNCKKITYQNLNKTKN